MYKEELDFIERVFININNGTINPDNITQAYGYIVNKTPTDVLRLKIRRINLFCTFNLLEERLTQIHMPTKLLIEQSAEVLNNKVEITTDVPKPKTKPKYKRKSRAKKK